MKNNIKKRFIQISPIINYYHIIKNKFIKSKLSQKFIMLRVLRYNTNRFLKYSGAFKKSKSKDTAYLIWLYHVIEKGLAMPHMHLGFGQEKVKELGKQLEHYANAYGKHNVTYQAAIETLYQYKTEHEQVGFVLPDDIMDIINSFVDKTFFQSERLGGGGAQEIHSSKTEMLHFQNLLRVDIQ